VARITAASVGGIARRVVPTLILVVGALGIVALARVAPATSESLIAERSLVPEFRPDAKASTWFCPGVPANDDSIRGFLVVSNSGQTPVAGTITRFATDGLARQQQFAIPARSTLEIDVLSGGATSFVAALIESQGSPIAVEQRTEHRAGDAVVPCATSPSDTWYLADGFTKADSIEQVVITNPSLDSAILDVSFVTALGERSPQSLKGVVIPPQSLRVFDMASLGARNEPTVAVVVEATVGRVVVGRSQHYLGRGRLGYTMTLAAAGSGSRWYFADGEKREGVTEEFVIFNPGTSDQLLTFIVSTDDGTPIDPLTVTAPARRITKFSPASLGALPEGRHSVVVTATDSLAGDSVGVVVERVSTRQVGKSTASAVVLGTPQPARAWIAPSGVAADTDDSLRIFNPGSDVAMIRITYLGPAGDVPITGFENIALSPGRATSIGLSGAAASATVTVSSTEPVVVQRRVPRGARQSVPGTAPLIVVATDAESCDKDGGCAGG